MRTATHQWYTVYTIGGKEGENMETHKIIEDAMLLREQNVGATNAEIDGAYEKLFEKLRKMGLDMDNDREDGVLNTVTNAINAIGDLEFINGIKTCLYLLNL